MSAHVTIGEFSRMTYLSVKTLRHYHEIGLLEPTRVNPDTGYRLYDAGQVATAQVIRRLRELDMPVDQVRAVLAAENLTSRNDVILRHLDRMQRQLAATQQTVSTLKALLSEPSAEVGVVYRSDPAQWTVAIETYSSASGPSDWFDAVFGQLHANPIVDRAGPDGALYYPEYFQSDRGRIVAFVPVPEPIASEELRARELPATDYAVALHTGSFESIDRTYGALGQFVAEQAISIDGPIRENYLSVTDRDTRIEVCWPIFRTEQPA
jgi:DNA-binding transcriptional MerR regulator/predicted transcriptional regulator YdeE